MQTVLVFIAAVAMLAMTSTSEAAQKFTCAGGDVDCLIAAMNEANANGQENVITLGVGVYSLTSLSDSFTGLPSITGNIAIQGVSAEASVIERATDAPEFRIFAVERHGILRLDRVTVRNGRAFLGGLRGGGILSLGTLSVSHSTISDSNSFNGGGIMAAEGIVTIAHSIIMRNSGLTGGGVFVARASATITKSTISNNFSDSDGGILLGEYFAPLGGGRLAISDSTISDNQARFGGQLTILADNTVTVSNSTVKCTPLLTRCSPHIDNAGFLTVTNATLGSIVQSTNSGLAQLENTITNDCFGTVESRGHNLIRDPTGCSIALQATDLIADPRLGEFTDNGTPGQGYFPLLPHSPAINAGGFQCPATDQIGRSRVHECDIGAIEFQPADVVTITQASYSPGSALLFVSATSSAADANLVLTIPQCLEHASMQRIGSVYLFVDPMNRCGNLNGETVTVTSSSAGSAAAIVR